MSKGGSGVERSFLYNKIKQDIMEQIEQGLYVTGDKLPSEAQLVSEYGVSRNTASRVLNDLVTEGYAKRHQGKGTFVDNQKITQDLSYVRSISSIFEQNKKESTSQVLAYEVVDPPAHVKKFLQLQDGEKAIRVYRIRYADKVPALLNETYRSHPRFGNVLHYDPTTVLSYGYLRKIKHIYPVHTEETLEVTFLNPDEAGYLGQKAGTPAFLGRSLTTDNTGQPLEVSKTIYRADMFRFASHLSEAPKTEK